VGKLMNALRSNISSLLVVKLPILEL